MSKECITTFYSAFQKLDYKTMATCYHPDATFKDEVFQLKGKEIADMWEMLCTRAQSFQLHFSDVESTTEHGSAHWEPKYVFSKTGKHVHNIIDATFTFKDGKILTHHDSFNFYAWAKQAFGFTGVLLGWLPFFRKKVVKIANESLRHYIKKTRS